MKPTTTSGMLREFGIVIALTLVFSFVLKTFFVQAFFIPSGSMENTLLLNDRVIVNKLSPRFSDLHRGDIVVFVDPGGWMEPTSQSSSPVSKFTKDALTFVGVFPQDMGTHLIKRVIGLPGDTVTCCDAQGRVSVNGVAIDERSYIFPGNAPSENAFGPVTVPEGHLWVMGDHRKHSADSRVNMNKRGGFVPIDNVVGQATLRMWPLNRWSTMDSHTDVFAAVPEPGVNQRGR